MQRWVRGVKSTRQQIPASTLLSGCKAKLFGPFKVELSLLFH